MSQDDRLNASDVDIFYQLFSQPEKRRLLVSMLNGLDLVQSVVIALTAPVNASSLANLSAANVGLEGQAPTTSLPLDPDMAHDRSLGFANLSIRDGNELTLSISDSNDDRGEDDDLSSVAARVSEVTVLHLAASMGLAKVGSILLKQNPNLDAVDETSETALDMAMDRGFESAVEFLLLSGAVVDLRHEHGQAVLLMVVERGWRKVGGTIVDMARAAKEDYESEEQRCVDRILAVYDGHIAKVKAIYDLVISSDEGMKLGTMALSLAIERDDQQTILYLLRAGVNVNSRDNSGQTVLHRATRRGNKETMRLILAEGAEVDSKDDDGRTAWSSNLHLSDTTILDILLRNGADPNTRGLQDTSELYSAGKNGEDSIVKYMLASGTSPSILTKHNWATLHWAPSYGHVECTRLLIEAGADLSPLSDQGVPPLDLAIQANQTVTTEMLMQAGAQRSSNPTLEGARAHLKTAERVDEWTYSEEYDPAVSKPDEEQETSVDKKLLMVWDKPLARTLLHPKMLGQFMYPNGAYTPKGHIYGVSHVLDHASATLSIRKFRTRARMHEYPLPAWYFDSSDVLFDIARLRADALDFELQPRQQAQTTGTLRLDRDWTGGWKLRHWAGDGSGLPQEIVRITPEFGYIKGDEDSRWTNEGGVLLARTGWDDGTPNMCFEPGVGRALEEAMIACWVTKLWSEFVCLESA